jgi:hypothetical protein
MPSGNHAIELWVSGAGGNGVGEGKKVQLTFRVRAIIAASRDLDNAQWMMGLHSMMRRRIERKLRCLLNSFLKKVKLDSMKAVMQVLFRRV